MISQVNMLAFHSFWFCLWIQQVNSVLGVTPSNIPDTSTAGSTRLELVKHYFYCGFSYPEIILLLFVINNIKISLRQLNRVLKCNNLRRRTGYTPDHIVLDYISKEIETSGQCIGYRSMWKRLTNEHKLRVPRNKVLSFMKTIDPDGINFRKAHRIKRRKYRIKGPNYVWHVDGYDKLKPYGFCIHGAIDGYSRRILWLEVSQSNNNPAVIAMYYLEALKTLRVVPRILRCDKGTENSTLSLLQPFFRYNDTDSISRLRSFIYGKSVSNQRIEAWWGTMRRQGIQWWISFFKDLKDNQEYDEINPLHVECLKFSFMHLIQAELDRIAVNWNLHSIRKQRNSEVPNGKHDLMYFVPELFGGHNYGKIVDQNDVDACCEMYGLRRTTCIKEFQDLVKLLKPDIRIPMDVQDALELYRELL
ncbi:uncharacterized protein LOC132760318 isoform X1 [Ruditapes philippinarum]|uniref:uncharacterized protein LOC132760318 isoform X1 n=2 Tax=Ruditapes philippinarum TaxID=129788 RepID=UPI00295B37F8|nr:uncharacterized protein LOC132760318 isoform X1 [Ruditapes philippinarum]